MSTKAVRFTEQEPEVFEYEQVDLPVEEKPEKIRSQERKDWFVDVMAVSMGIRMPVQVLEEVSFEGVARYIASGKCSKIITMAGAGISTSAGIPDYRSPGTGLMDQMKDKYPNIKHVTDLFNIQFFLKDPKPFFERSKRFFEISLKPTPCHYFVRLLHEKGLLLRHYTQNIDTLERLAGIPGETVIEAHGSYYTSHCMMCDAEYSFDWLEEKVLKDQIPTCEENDCTGVIKPDIVMYGEALNDRFRECADEDTINCDLLIVMGTALAVQPFASLTGQVKTSTPRLYINLDRGNTAKKHPMTELMFGGSFDFDGEENIRDVHKAEKCDEACYAMADLIGWGEELRSLVEMEHERIEEEDKQKGKVKAPPLESFTEVDPQATNHPTTTTLPPSESDTSTSQKPPSENPSDESSTTEPAKTTTRKTKDCSPRPDFNTSTKVKHGGAAAPTNRSRGSSHKLSEAAGKSGTGGQPASGKSGSTSSRATAAKPSAAGAAKGKQLASSGQKAKSATAGK